jgi:hypothetical protein
MTEQLMTKVYYEILVAGVTDAGCQEADSLNAQYILAEVPSDVADQRHFQAMFATKGNFDALHLVLIGEPGQGQSARAYFTGQNGSPSWICNSVPATALKFDLRRPLAGAVGQCGWPDSVSATRIETRSPASIPNLPSAARFAAFANLASGSGLELGSGAAVQAMDPRGSGAEDVRLASTGNGNRNVVSPTVLAEKHDRAASADGRQNDSGLRVAVYTVVLGNYDSLCPPPSSTADFICFTDDPATVVSGWQVREVSKVDLTSDDARVRAARRIKLLPHEYLPDYDVWIWIDGNLALVQEPRELASRYLKCVDLVTFKYPGNRDCLYDEAQACIERKKDDDTLIREHVRRYHEEGFPAHQGLVETSVILRRNTPTIRRFNETWWHELTLGSRRDQLSFNYVAWKLRQPYGHVPGSRKKSSIARWSPHRVDIYEPDRAIQLTKPCARLTLLLLNWQRPQNLKLVLQSIEEQTVRPKVFLWNNGPRFEHPLVDWRVESSLNQRCWPRWCMGAMAETEYVCSLDDDFAFGDERVLQDLIEFLDKLDHPERAVGAAGVVLDPAKAYGQCRHIDRPLPVDTSVDIVKGKLFACRTDALRSTAMIGAIREDDIALSGMLAQGRQQFHCVAGLFHNRMRWLPEMGVGLCGEPRHQLSREAARRAYCAT